MYITDSMFDVLLVHEELLRITTEKCLRYNLSACLLFFHISGTTLLYKFFSIVLYWRKVEISQVKI